MKLSVVIPCLNESESLEKAIGMAQDLVRAFDGDGEVVIGDNGSTDGSQTIAERCGARVVSVPDKGYGFAVRGGFAAARGDVLVMGDADATYDFREAKALVDRVLGGVDLAMGSRLRGNIEQGAMPFLHRYLGTPVLTMIIRVLFRMRITDCNCGMRAISKKAFESLHCKCGGMEFASEMICRAGLCRLTVSEDPISLYADRRNREPHLHTWRDGWRHLKLILGVFITRGRL